MLTISLPSMRLLFKKMWKPHCPTTLVASTASYKDSFPSSVCTC
jgi:hypothetical protein